MANAVRVRVELKHKYNDPERNFKEMKQEFKRACDNAGILHDYKEHESFESKTRKKRRKKREAINKKKMETLVEKIIAGERVKAPSGFIKKVLLDQKKLKNSKGHKYNRNREE